MPPTEPATTEDLDLIAKVLTASTAHTTAVTNQVIEGLTRRAVDAEATVAAIRAGVQALLDHASVPNPTYLEAALYPPDTLVDHFRLQIDRAAG